MISSAEENHSPAPTPTVEDYLWLIFTLERDGEDVIGARLAELLQVSAPTVTVTLKRMIRDGWVEMDEHKHILLTEEGTEAAKKVLRRHMLVEWLLAEMLNVPWSRLHEEAHQLEHYISDDVERRLTQQLGNPNLCPHGNPIPGNEKVVDGWCNLIDTPVDAEIIIRRIHEHAENRPALMKFFQENKIMPGEHAVMREVLPFNETITVEIGGEPVVLDSEIAKYIFVQIN